MNEPARKLNPGLRRRRYLVHLYCVHDESSRACRFASRTQLWRARSSGSTKTYERIFTDEYELIEVINPLLRHGSDVRNVISHIESSDGFLYLLNLSCEEAISLGWLE